VGPLVVDGSLAQLEVKTCQLQDQPLQDSQMQGIANPQLPGAGYAGDVHAIPQIAARPSESLRGDCASAQTDWLVCCICTPLDRGLGLLVAPGVGPGSGVSPPA
jgi:hypothetical protein